MRRFRHFWVLPRRRVAACVAAPAPQRAQTTPHSACGARATRRDGRRCSEASLQVPREGLTTLTGLAVGLCRSCSAHTTGVLPPASYGSPLSSSPAATLSPLAIFTSVEIRRSRMPRSALANSTGCRPARWAASSWVIPSSARRVLMFAPTRCFGSTSGDAQSHSQ